LPKILSAVIKLVVNWLQQTKRAWTSASSSMPWRYDQVPEQDWIQQRTRPDGRITRLILLVHFIIGRFTERETISNANS